MAVQFDSGIFSVIGLASELLVGAKLYWYTTGTSTPLATYSNNALTIPNANPVIADAAGRFPPIFLQQATYKFILKSAADVTLVTRDPWSGLDPAVVVLADLASSDGAGLVGFSHAETYATGTLGKKGKAQVYANDAPFNAVGDGTTNDTAALTAARAYAQSIGADEVILAPGIYAINSTIALTGNAVTFVGQVDAPMQQGSNLPPVTLRWTGGASPMFTLDQSGAGFVGMAIENAGTATDVIEVTSGQFLLFKQISLLLGSGASRFSRSVIHTNGNHLGYSRFETIHCLGAAPRFLDIDGQATPNGLTPIMITGRCLFESNSAGDMTVVYTNDENIEGLIITENTFNQQLNELTIVDNSSAPLNPAMYSFVFENNEIDTSTAIAADRMFRLSNVENIAFNNNTIQAGGLPTAMADLVNSTVVSCSGNSVSSLAGPMFNCDATSRVYPGVNQLTLANSRGVVNDSATASGNVPLTYATTVILLGNLLPFTGGVFQITVTDAVAWTLSYTHPLGGYFTKGQTFKVLVRNTSGGAGGVISVVGAIKVSAALAVPADGFSRTTEFMWNGTNLIELSRSAADVPN